MNKKRNFYWFVIFIIVSGLIFLGIKLSTKQKIQYPDPYKIVKQTSKTSAPELTGIKWINDDSWLLVTQKDNKIPATYYENDGTEEFYFIESKPMVGKNIVLTDEHTKIYTYKEPEMQPDGTKTVEYFLTIYKVEKDALKKEKTIDMNEIANAIHEGYTADTVRKLSYDENYVIFYVLNSEEEYYYFRLSDEKVLTKAEAPQDLVQKVEVDKDTGSSPYSDYLFTDNKQSIIDYYPEAEEIYDNDEKAILFYVENPPKIKEE